VANLVPSGLNATDQRTDKQVRLGTVREASLHCIGRHRPNNA
jgi:hypothetical protein